MALWKSFMNRHRAVKILSCPRCMFPVEVEQDNTLSSCFSSHNVNKSHFAIILWKDPNELFSQPNIYCHIFSPLHGVFCFFFFCCCFFLVCVCVWSCYLKWPSCIVLKFCLVFQGAGRLSCTSWRKYVHHRSSISARVMVLSSILIGLEFYIN